MDFLFGGSRKQYKKCSKRCKKGGEETHFNESAEEADFKDAQISDLKTVKPIKLGEYDEKKQEVADYNIGDDVKIEKKDVEGATPQAGGKRRSVTKKPVKKTVKRSNKKGGNCSLATSSAYPFEDAISPKQEGGKKRKSVKKISRKKGGEGGLGENVSFDETKLAFPEFNNEEVYQDTTQPIEGGGKRRKSAKKPVKKGGNDDYASVVGGAKKSAKKCCKKGGNTIYDSDGGGKGKKEKKDKKGGVVNLTPFISALALFSARMYSEQTKTKDTKAKASKSKSTKK